VPDGASRYKACGGVSEWAPRPKNKGRPRRLTGDRPGGVVEGSLCLGQRGRRSRGFHIRHALPNPVESLMPGERVVVAGFEPMSEITVVLDPDVATQLVKRIKHPFHVNVGGEAAFQKLLATLDSALQTD